MYSLLQLNLWWLHFISESLICFRCSRSLAVIQLLCSIVWSSTHKWHEAEKGDPTKCHHVHSGIRITNTSPQYITMICILPTSIPGILWHNYNLIHTHCYLMLIIFTITIDLIMQYLSQCLLPHSLLTHTHTSPAYTPLPQVPTSSPHIDLSVEGYSISETVRSPLRLPSGADW